MTNQFHTVNKSKSEGVKSYQQTIFFIKYWIDPLFNMMVLNVHDNVFACLSHHHFHPLQHILHCFEHGLVQIV